jgi:peptide/nickel transport system substrate-binding protein
MLLTLVSALVILVLAVQCTPAATPTTAPAAPTTAPVATTKPADPTLVPTAKPVEPTKVPTAAGPARGGIFVDSSFADGVSLQPLITSDNASTLYQGRVWAPLTRIDPKTLEITGVLYEDKPTISADGAKLTWKLRPGVKWSDGKPITSADVVFTWEKMMDEKTKFLYRSTYKDSFTEVKAIDDTTVEYTLKTPGYCPAIVNSGLFGPIPKHVYETLDVNTADVNVKPVVTSGYFKLKEWQKDDHITFSPAYEGFVRGQPIIDGYTYRIVKDSTVQTQLFKTGDVDYAAIDPADWNEVSKLANAQPRPYYPAVGASWTYIGFNLRNPILSDKVVRQAISTAINKKEMTDQIRLGHAKPQFSMLPSSSWAAADEKDLPQFNFDPAKAKKMLADAGYKAGADGILVSKDGKPLKFRLHYNAGNKQREQIAIITQQYLKDIGIATEVIAEEWNAYLDRINKNYDMDMYIVGWTGGFDPSSTKNIWSSKGGQNNIKYVNEEVDKLYAQAEVVPGCKQADRKALYVQIQKLIAEDAPYVFLYTNETLDAFNKRVNLNPLTGTGSIYNIEQLSIVPLAQK